MSWAIKKQTDLTNSTREGLPQVAEDQGNRPLWLGIGLIALVGLLFFVFLETRRVQKSVPALRPLTEDYSQRSVASFADLFVPPETVASQIFYPQQSPDMGSAERPRQVFRLPTVREEVSRRSPFSRNASRPVNAARIEPAPVIVSQFQAPTLPPATLSPPVNVTPAIVFDNGIRLSEVTSGSNANTISAGPSRVVARNSLVKNSGNGLLVSQGTLIPAVLETAIDSTQPGQARALVSSNIFNRAGTAVLIPKGSRLFGEYKGEASAGKGRINVQWTKLLRPDGVEVALDSPAGDTLGRAGIKAKVNTHFLQTFAGALLQSTIDIGTMAVSRGVSGTGVIVALPSSGQAAASQLVPPAPPPTLKVKHGTRISVLVARDLDFSYAGSAQ